MPQKDLQVRLCLPKDVTLILQCDRDATLDSLVGRSIAHLSDLLKVTLDKAFVQVVADDQEITDTRLAVSSLPYVATVLNSAGTPPTLHVNYKGALPSDEEEEDDEMLEEESRGQADLTDGLSEPTPVAVAVAPAAVSLPPPLTKSLPLPPPIVGAGSAAAKKASIAAVANLPSKPELPQGYDASATSKSTSTQSVAGSIQSTESSTHHSKSLTNSADAIAAAAPSAKRMERTGAVDRRVSLYAGGSEVMSVMSTIHVSSLQHVTELFVVNFIFPGNVGFTWEFTGDTPISVIKSVLWDLKESINVVDLKGPETYCLKYTDPDELSIELFDEDQLL